MLTRADSLPVIVETWLSAAPVLRFSADGGATWTVVVDNGPLDGISLPGFISYDGPVGDWYVNTESAIGAPLAGTALAPVMDLGTDNQSSNTAMLIVQMSDINFTAIPNERPPVGQLDRLRPREAE